MANLNPIIGLHNNTFQGTTSRTAEFLHEPSSHHPDWAIIHILDLLQHESSLKHSPSKFQSYFKVCFGTHTHPKGCPQNTTENIENTEKLNSCYC